MEYTYQELNHYVFLMWGCVQIEINGTVMESLVFVSVTLSYISKK